MKRVLFYLTGNTARMNHQTGTFTTFDKRDLYWQAWQTADPKAINLYLHGSFSNSSEADNLAESLADLNISTYAFDQRGWGNTTHRTGYIRHRKQMLEDFEYFLHFVKSKHPDVPLILSGHSMGGLISLRLLLDHEDKFMCSILSSPWIETRANPAPLLESLSGILSLIWPTFSQPATFEVDVVTHDNARITRYHKEIEDGTKKMRATVRWYVQMKKLQQEVFAGADRITLPILIAQAGQDLLVKEGRSRQIYDNLTSENKKWCYFPNFYHEVFNEEERETSLKEVQQFITELLEKK